MGNTFYFGFEKVIIEFLQSFLNPFTEALSVFFTYFGEETALILILGYLYWCYDKEFGKFVATNVSVGLILCPMVKNIICRTRPYMDIETVKAVRPPEPDKDPFDIVAQGYSCPSGHSLNSAIVYGSLPVYKKNNKFLKIIAIVCPLLVGFSRVILGAHYPTDVLFGWTLGAVVIFLISFLQRKVQRKWILYVCLLAVSAIGIFYCRTDDYFTGLGVMLGLFLVFPFEEKFVNFEKSPGVLDSVLRIVLGVVIFVILNSALKIILKSDVQMGQFLLRTVRYAIDIFVLFGLYPILFKHFPRKKA